MKHNGIKLSEVIESLDLLKRLCKINIFNGCTMCWLYNQEEKACLLNKTKLDAVVTVNGYALRYIAQQQGCIMPECPYCPTCEHGFVSYPEDTFPGEEDINTEWHCMYDPEVSGGDGNGEKDQGRKND